MRNYKYILFAAALVAAASSCSDKVRIEGTLSGAPDSQVVIKQLAGSSFNVLDTVKIDASGSYSYKMEVAEGQPEFVYIFSGDTKIASLLLQKGDNVKVVSDANGSYTVEGSPESENLRKLEGDFATFLSDFSSALERDDAPAASRKYVDYYRSRVKYLMENSKSLTCVPVLYQKINEDFPVFSQATDAVLFKNIHDSLATVYPESRYVLALGKEAERRINTLSLEQRLLSASEAGFPDLELPTVDGGKARLGDVDAKLIMVYFWQASDASQKMFNQDVLMPIYKTYHPKGLEIYSVSLDTDKGTWASAVKNQELPWINVCDGLGTATPAVSLYNVVRGLPVAYFIADGALTSDVVTSEKDIRRLLASRLK